MTTIYRATLETRHFEFEAFAETPEKARGALSRGLRTHCRQYDVGFNDFVSSYGGDIVIRPVEIGAVYRGYEQIETRP